MATSLYGTLKAGVGELWAKAQTHPFVNAIGDGTLPREKFAYYLMQDHLYLVGYSRALSIAMAKVRDYPWMNGFARLVNDTLNVEMQLHRELCTEFGIPSGELLRAKPSPTCQANIDFFMATAAMGDEVDLLATMLPCEVGYVEIGICLAKEAAGKPDHPYRKWIDTYAADEYQEFARWMISVFNHFAVETSDEHISHLQHLFTLGCRYMWLFWEMAWTEEQWPV